MADPVGRFIKAMQAATGIQPTHLQRAMRAGVVTPDMDPETAYRAASKFFIDSRATSRQLELPLGPGAPEPEVRSLIVRGIDNPMSPDYVPDVNQMGVSEGSFTGWAGDGANGLRGPDYDPATPGGSLARIDSGYRGYSLPGAAGRPMGLVPTGRELATLPRGVAINDPGYRRGVTVDAVDVADPSYVPMAGRGLPYVDPAAAAQARYRQATAPAVEHGNELDAMRRFREATTDPKSSFVDRVQDVVRNGSDAIAGAARTAGRQAGPALRQAGNAINGNAIGAGLSAAVGASGIASLAHLLNDDNAVSSGGEAELAAESRPVPSVQATAPVANSVTVAPESDKSQASPGSLRRQMRQMPIDRPTPASDVAQQSELKLIDGNAHLAKSAPTPSELTADYRAERRMYDLAKKTGKSIAELRTLPEFANVGSMRGGQYTRADGSVGTMATASARDLAAQARIDDERERMQRWKSQMLLSSSNPRANAANAFAMLSPEAQQRVIESRFTYGGAAPEMDARVQAAMIESQARAAAQREAIALEEKRIAAGKEASIADREDKKAERDQRKAIADQNDATLNRQIDVGASSSRDARDADAQKLYADLASRLALAAYQGQNRLDAIGAEHSAKSQLPPSAEALNQFALQEKQNALSQAALDWADKNIKKRYAADSGFMNWVPGWSSQFTAREQGNAYNDLRAQFPQLPEDQIRNILRSIAARKSSEPASY